MKFINSLPNFTGVTQSIRNSKSMKSAFGHNDSIMIPIRCRADTFKIKARMSTSPEEIFRACG
jgi:hypothetical protein